MPLTKDQIKNEALQLAPFDREALAEELLLSISGDDRASLDAVWLSEVRRRDAMPLLLGTNAQPIEAVLDGLERRLRT
jgi:hypothetical protein